MVDNEERGQRGRRAASEFRELDAAFKSVSDAIMTKLVQTPVNQPETVLQLHLAVQNLAGVRKALLMVVQDGVMADAAVEASGLVSGG